MNITAPSLQLINSEKWWHRRRYRLTEDWTPFKIGGHLVIFPKCFETDLASTPSIMWWLPGLSPSGPLAYGAIPHDFGYQHQYLLSVYDKNSIYPEESWTLRESYPHLFMETMPILVGRPQRDFDYLLSSITIKATGATCVAQFAKFGLALNGNEAWRKYRKFGPGAYNCNTLKLPGLTTNGSYLI